MFSASAFVLFFLACIVLAFARHPIYGLVLYLSVTYIHPPSRWWSYAAGSGWSFMRCDRCSVLKDARNKNSNAHGNDRARPAEVGPPVRSRTPAPILS
jgi:hypothetical protein